jgi:uncharacterized membrane protein YfcA
LSCWTPVARRPRLSAIGDRRLLDAIQVHHSSSSTSGGDEDVATVHTACHTHLSLRSSTDTHRLKRERDAVTEPGPDRRLVRAIAVGIIAGVASGLFGVGGGIVIVPGLVWLTGLDQRKAHGTSLTAIVPIALAGTLGYATGGKVDLTVAALTAAGALLGTPLGVALLGRLPDRTLRLAFAVVLALSAVRLLLAGSDGAGREELTLLLGAGYLLTGLVAGLLSGVMGVGGGVIMVPIFSVLFGLPILLAKGTSLAVIVPGALVGTLRNRAQGTTDIRTGITVGLSGVVTASLASQLSLGLDPVVSRRLFAALLVIVIVRMVRKLLTERSADAEGVNAS